MQLESLTGSVLDQNYKIEKQLGKGAMGAVFQATHLGTMRAVALKVIMPKLAAEAEFSQRFKREAEAAGRLRHPNVVNVTDFGVTHVDDGGLAYMVMEYLDGQTLAAHLKSDPRPSFNFIVDVVDQTALALDAAHEAGIVHRDLKPSNIWLEPNHRGGYNVKVLDFGIAKVTGQAAEKPSRPAATEEETIVMMRTAAAVAVSEETVAVPSLMASPSHLETTVGTLLGTPAYMAPEQCQGLEVDYRADIYSLATIVYEMLCSRLPFQAEDFRQLVQMQLHEAPRPPSERDPSVPAAVSDAVMCGLAKDPALRPPSAATFAARLRSVMEGDLTPIRKSRDVVIAHGNCFLPLLEVCMASAAVLVAAAWAAAHLAYQAYPGQAPLLIALLSIATFAGIVFATQLYKAGCSLVLRRAAANRQFQPALGEVVSAIIRAMPALLGTQLRSLADLRPRSFRENVLWPVVWAIEGRSGRDGIERSRQLCRSVSGGAVTGVMARQIGPPAFLVLVYPALMSLAGTGIMQFVMRKVLSGTIMGTIYLVFPLIPAPLYMYFGSASTFLYWSALLCRGEGGDITLPTSTRNGKRGRFSAGLGPATRAWLALPLVLLAVLLFGRTMADSGTVLESASNDGRRAAVLKALNSGLSVDERLGGGETPLFEAVRSGDRKLVEELLSRGADVNVRSRLGSTALLAAATYGRDDLARALLDHGAALDVADEEGRTPLIDAAMRGNLPLVRLLLERGADRKHSDAHGKTALTYAREEGYQEIAELVQ